jgi:acetolactate decarboxylase
LFYTMAAKIPNDIYQFSLLSALHSGLNLIGPPVRALQAYGTDGIGYLPRNSGELLFLDSTAFQILPNAEDLENECVVEHAPGELQLPFVIVTKYVPEFLLDISGDTEMESLMDLFGCEGPLAGGKNSIMPFRLRGTFGKIELGTVGPAKGRRASSKRLSASSSSGTSEKEQVHELLDVKGTIFGFVGPKWLDGISVTGFHCFFLCDRNAEGKVRGGRVKNFKAHGSVELTWSLSGHLHLGLPSGEEWESLDLDGGMSKVDSVHSRMGV